MFLAVADASVVILKQYQGSLCKNKHEPGMFTLSLECIRCAKLDFARSLTNGPEVVRGHCWLCSRGIKGWICSALCPGLCLSKGQWDSFWKILEITHRHSSRGKLKNWGYTQVHVLTHWKRSLMAYRVPSWPETGKTPPKGTVFCESCCFNPCASLHPQKCSRRAPPEAPPWTGIINTGNTIVEASRNAGDVSSTWLFLALASWFHHNSKGEETLGHLTQGKVWV